MMNEIKTLVVALTELAIEARAYLADARGKKPSSAGYSPVSDIGEAAPPVKKRRGRRKKVETVEATEATEATEAAEANGNGHLPEALTKLSEADSSKLVLSVCRTFVEKDQKAHLEEIRGVMRDKFKTERMSNLTHPQRVTLIHYIQEREKVGG